MQLATTQPPLADVRRQSAIAELRYATELTASVAEGLHERNAAAMHAALSSAAPQLATASEAFARFQLLQPTKEALVIGASLADAVAGVQAIQEPVRLAALAGQRLTEVQAANFVPALAAAQTSAMTALHWLGYHLEA